MAYLCKYNNRECIGCGDCRSEKSYYCPICGEEVYEVVYVTNDGVVLGCENCAQIKEPCDMIQDDEDARADEEYEYWREKKLEDKLL